MGSHTYLAVLWIQETPFFFPEEKQFLADLASSPQRTEREFPRMISSPEFSPASLLTVFF